MTHRLIFAALCLLLSGAAHALCLKPLCSCSVATSTLALGSYNPLAGANADSSATLAVNCGGVAGLLIPFEIALSTGTGGSYAGRALASGARRLNYNLYTDSTYTAIWGNGSGGSVTVQGGILLDALGLAPPANYRIYGRIPAGQTTAAPGAYADTITVTVTYF